MNKSRKLDTKLKNQMNSIFCSSILVSISLSLTHSFTDNDKKSYKKMLLQSKYAKEFIVEEISVALFYGFNLKAHKTQDEIKNLFKFIQNKNVLKLF